MLLMFAATLYYKQGDFQQSYDTAERALDKDPDLHAATHLMGLCQSQLARRCQQLDQRFVHAERRTV